MKPHNSLIPYTGRTTPSHSSFSARLRTLGVLGLLLIGAVVTLAPMTAQAQQFRRAMFPHRSVGLCFWDRSQVSNLTPPTTMPNEVAKYNTSHGLSGSNAVHMVDFPTEPGGDPTPVGDIGNAWYDWVNVFSGADAWSSTFYSLMDQYPVVIVKTGYPATQYMNTSDSITAYQSQWRRIIGYMRNRPQNFFVITTNYPAATDGHAQRDAYSNTFCSWAKNILAEGNDSFGAFPPNVLVFDWFHMLASSSDGYCDPVYGSFDEGPGGDHPSNAAVAVIDPVLIQQTFDAAIAYEGGPLAATWAGPPTLTGIAGSGVVVKWETLSETNTYRFYVQRQGTAWVTIDSVDAGGTSLSRRQYAVTDASVPAGTWTYRIKELDRNGAVHYSQTVSATLSALPTDVHITTYALQQNYPNPFNPVTTIRFALPAAGYVTLKVFNLLGQETATLVNEIRPAGEYSVPFNGSGLSSGMYFYRLQAGSFVDIKSLVLLR